MLDRQKADDKLKVEKIAVRIYVKSDGTLGDVLMEKGDPESRFSQLTLKSIKETSGKLPPFPEALSALLGIGYWDLIAFNLYDSEVSN